MVASKGTTSSPRRLRPLAGPVSLQVEADAKGRPVRVRLPVGWRSVQVVIAIWRLEDEWWRERPISRRYWHIELGTGKRINVFQDLIDGAWYRQP